VECKFRQLVQHTDEVATFWKEIALNLGISTAKVDRINGDHDKLREKCYNMFKTWFQLTVNPCWCQFISALESVELFQLATKMKQKYLTTGIYRSFYGYYNNLVARIITTAARREIILYCVAHVIIDTALILKCILSVLCERTIHIFKFTKM